MAASKAGSGASPGSGASRVISRETHQHTEAFHFPTGQTSQEEKSHHSVSPPERMGSHPAPSAVYLAAKLKETAETEQATTRIKAGPVSQRAPAKEII